MTNPSHEPIRWATIELEEWHFHIAATSKGLCYVGSQHAPIEELETWVKKHFPKQDLVQDEQGMQPYKQEIINYLQGNLHAFTLPSDYQGTTFQREVWEALCHIPYGQTMTYSDIAHHIQKPAAVRAVGTAIGANPLLLTIPCHRVIGKDGSLSGYRGGLEIKKQLLALEGSFHLINR
ncbi:methylated-DNA--[protein]-cysteine S-methyltransferase [Paenibacillus sp. N1-5-1-14]|uniref:methylated-DNA--[protein]-cysteine S-methyltransferase n=1 Tax=Paenibacillus radicibacter TaxID=2972488 RepID=UPI0021597512|nr:methylated-DNA--[protein]-cysteine S-methyltransferase [Paenibacillus radicibacter]MCR8644627.1 methylated-DNA--[protein]-cysteine S-methyltransferase [Paenibacillus radicibacter]